MAETALIKLTWVEVRAAANHAVHRRIYHEELGTPHRANIPRECMPWDFEVNGAVAELAFCKLLNCYWSGLEGNKAADCRYAEIRSTVSGKKGLWFYPSDGDLRAVLAQVRLPAIEFIGWYESRRGKQDCFWCEAQPGRWLYEVPRPELRPIRELVTLIRTERRQAHVLGANASMESASGANGYAGGRPG